MSATDGQAFQSYGDELNQAEDVIVSCGASLITFGDVKEAIAVSGRRYALRHGLLLDHKTGARCV